MNRVSLKYMDFIRRYGLIVICLFVIVASSFVFIVPGVQNIFSAKTEIKEKEEQREVNDKKIAVLSNQNSLSLEKDLTNSLLALPDHYNGPSLLNSLEKIASASGVTFSGLQFAEQNKSAGKTTTVKSTSVTKIDVSNYQFSLSVTADFAHIIAMLRNFENSLPLFSVENVTVRALGDSSGDISFSFGLSTYYEPLPEEIVSNKVLSEVTGSEKDLLAEIEGYSNYPLVPDTSGVGKTNPFR